MNDDCFNGTGEFHGQMKSKWIALKRKDPKFDSQRHKAQFNIDMGAKCPVVIVIGKLDVWKNPKHLTMCIKCIFGHCCAFHDVQEHHDLAHDCVH
jgi:hypothetical protein